MVRQGSTPVASAPISIIINVLRAYNCPYYVRANLLWFFSSLLRCKSVALDRFINRIREIRLRSVWRSARLPAPVMAICSTTLPQCSSSGTTHCISRRWEISHDLYLDHSTRSLRERQHQKTRLALRPELGHPNL